MKILCYKGKGRNPWRWRLLARNGKVISDSAEGYATRRNLAKAVARVNPMLRFRVAVVWR